MHDEWKSFVEKFSWVYEMKMHMCDVHMYGVCWVLAE